MAVARPAGPPPITNTSTGFGKLLTINFLSTNFLPSISYLNALLPFQQNEFRAEPGTHRGQQAERTGFGAAILHDFFEHHQHGSRRQVASPAQALPGNVEFTILQAERFGGRLQNLRPAGMQRPTADVRASQSALGKKIVEIARQVFSNQIRNLTRENDTKALFRYVPAHHFFGVGIEHGAGCEDAGSGKPAIGAGDDYRGGAVSEQPGRNEVGHRDILALQRERAEFDR